MKDNDMIKLQEALLEEAIKGVRSGDGGPFAAAIVKEGKVICMVHNEVFKTNDPTAHAEIQAIRLASQILDTYELHGCTLFTSCEPCPMCMSAILWARIDKLHYLAERKVAHDYGFDDLLFYDAIKKGAVNKLLDIRCGSVVDARKPFREWESIDVKKKY